ncbi:hypothetical protein [Gemmata sp.]|uniref:hypothetical protein n=1 Tax=Gemmata sp. TaxID=1914242 RepID=UPI003F6FAA2A
MSDSTDPRDQHLAAREAAVTQARDDLRAERERVAADRAAADRLLAEARAAHADAARARSRARRLAARFASRLEQRTADTRQRLAEQFADLAADREKFAGDVSQLNAVRSEFHAAAAAARDRIAAAWGLVEAHQKRAAAEWGEAARYFTEQNAALEARAAEVQHVSRAAAEWLARTEAENAGLQEEAAALEHRVRNARTVLTELELRRDRIRTELLSVELPEDLVRTPNPDDLAHRELLLNRERGAVAALRSALEQEAADVDDRRRLVAEQLAQLAEARSRWHRAERQTVLEMEDLARSLRHKEQDLDAREQRLIRADARRRAEAYDLWQLRLKLEAWQSNLTAFEARWQAEREQLEAYLERRIATVTRREAAHAGVFARWEQARASDHTRLREELRYWAADRERMTQAIAEFNRVQEAVLADLTRYASRAMAAEQAVGEALHDSGSHRIVRRLRVLRRRWERLFARHAKSLLAHRERVAEERAALEGRYHDLHERLVRVGEREADVTSQQTAADRATLAEATAADAASLAPATLSAPSAELVALRAEVERLAAVVLDIDLPESEVPWAIEEPEPHADLLSFGPSSRAA